MKEFKSRLSKNENTNLYSKKWAGEEDSSYSQDYTTEYLRSSVEHAK